MTKKKSKSHGRVLKDNTYVSKVTAGKLGGEVPVAMMPLSRVARKQIGFEPGAIFSLAIGDAELTGLVIETEVPSPLIKKEIAKRRRIAKNFGTAQVTKTTVFFEIIKQTRVRPFRFPEGEHPARLKVIEKPAIANTKSATAKAVKSRQDAVAMPKSLSMPSSCIDTLVEMTLRDQHWTSSIVFELNGKIWMGRVDISPPYEGVNIVGSHYKIGAEVSATVGEHRKGGVASVASKNFRGWPCSVGRAFLHVAKKAKGGTLMLEHVELKIVARAGKKPTRVKAAEAATLAAWKEILGIE